MYKKRKVKNYFSYNFYRPKKYCTHSQKSSHDIIHSPLFCYFFNNKITPIPLDIGEKRSSIYFVIHEQLSKYVETLSTLYDFLIIFRYKKTDAQISTY